MIKIKLSTNYLNIQFELDSIYTFLLK